MAKIKSINPSDYSVMGEVEVSTKQEVIDKIKLAHDALKGWREIGLEKRVELLRKVTDELKDKKEELALMQSTEMGIPLTDALINVDGNTDYANWYFDNAVKYLSPETTFESETEIHQVFYEPIGVVAVIIPWNFPHANIIWGGLQSLIAGNTIVLKHSEECPICAKYIGDIFEKYLPLGVFNQVFGDGEVGKILVNDNINMIAFTGSTKTGKYLYELAGKKFIKAIMELGGSAPAIVFDDADIGITIENITANRLLNQGQCCDGLKRLIVQENVAGQVIEKLTKNFTGKVIGKATELNTQIGPLVSKKQLDLLVSQVKDAISKGAKVICGGKSLEEKMGGAYFEPTILADVTADMRVWNEEVFGPVLPVMKFTTEEEAVKLANDTTYGLGSYLYTANQDRINRISSQIEAGMMSVNGTNYIIPQNPFGGYKNSGFGREHGKYGFAEVTQIKVVARNK
ncbi:hypothetical protein AUK05_01700 [Candidatus Shapirobacteria bacterium CG2_30_35_20]|uniref:Aldehyde dehydrogenase domain-containing protein n=1 Tax=Candidatus Shapirobacteria bacterium CG2_30_35_20 TaxID=1805376 RepID=A0A1J5HS22_9BACT|nr:MAG: hypothetical protein AUK05_01700 [Candidatus Shapirobacteria bacterium CG2_30_35_20]